MAVEEPRNHFLRAPPSAVCVFRLTFHVRAVFSTSNWKLPSSVKYASLQGERVDEETFGKFLFLNFPTRHCKTRNPVVNFRLYVSPMSHGFA